MEYSYVEFSYSARRRNRIRRGWRFDQYTQPWYRSKRILTRLKIHSTSMNVSVRLLDKQETDKHKTM